MSQTEKPYIGGQAVLEGVMMRAPKALTVAVRRPDGSIVVRESAFTSRFDHAPWKWPLFRGVAALVESMRLGYGALAFSAEQQMTEEERASEGNANESRFAMMLSVVLALGLFVATPQALASGVANLLGLSLSLESPLFHAMIGGFKLCVLFGYLVFVGSIPEMRRVFQYHGAEHMTIHTYEQGLPLTVDNVRAQTTLHPRCGTTFLVLVVLVSIVVGSTFAPLLLPDVSGALGWALLLALRIAMLPAIAAVSFEMQRFTARFCTTGPLQVLLWPGFLFQKISTRRPDDQQIEVAIAAMRAAAWRDRVGEAEASGDEPHVFPNLEALAARMPELPAAA
jgi:uncharacterized protein YqhQ